MRFRVLVVALVAAAAFLVTGIAMASVPANPSCWGVVTSQFASTAPGAVGAHASEPPELDLFPRPGRLGWARSCRRSSSDM